MDMPAFEAPYLLARYLAPKMGYRQYKSAIIVRSQHNADDEKVEKGTGVVKGCRAALDAFGALLHFEFT